jgi:hypothetical protein
MNCTGAHENDATARGQALPGFASKLLKSGLVRTAAAVRGCHLIFSRLYGGRMVVQYGAYDGAISPRTTR